MQADAVVASASQKVRKTLGSLCSNLRATPSPPHAAQREMKCNVLRRSKQDIINV